MRVRFGLDELGIHADDVTRSPYASLQHIAHAQLATDLAGDDRLVPVGERSISGDHNHVRDPRQIGRQILGDPVCKVLLLGVVAEIGERQHDNRQARRSDGRRA